MSERTLKNTPIGSSDESTRRRVTELILERGPSTATQLAETLHLTPAAIRRHIGVLLDSGLIEARQQRVYGGRSRGRPSKVFLLTAKGRAAFYQAYDELAITAIKYLINACGEKAVRDLAKDRVTEVEKRFDELRKKNPEKTAVSILAAALSEDGYVASIEPIRSGDQLCQHHCPVVHVAEQFPELCEAETQVFSKLLGTHVQRLATIAHGDGVCTTHIPISVIPKNK